MLSTAWLRNGKRWENLHRVVLPLDSCLSTVDYIAPKFKVVFRKVLEKYTGSRCKSSERGGQKSNIFGEWFLKFADMVWVSSNAPRNTCKAFIEEASVLPYGTIIKYKGKVIGLMDKGFTKQ